MNGFKILFLLLVVVAIVIGWPIAIIWSLNVLFPMAAIPITLETWTAAFVITLALNGGSTYARKR